MDRGGCLERVNGGGSYATQAEVSEALRAQVGGEWALNCF
jgi:hypothetical protein